MPAYAAFCSAASCIVSSRDASSAVELLRPLFFLYTCKGAPVTLV